MSHLINISDKVYDELSRRKRMRGVSYSEEIMELLRNDEEEKKSLTIRDLVSSAKVRAAKHVGKKTKTDIDKIVYGVSRDSG